VNALALLDDLRHTLSCRNPITEVQSYASTLPFLAAVWFRCSCRAQVGHPGARAPTPAELSEGRRTRGGRGLWVLPSGGVFVTARLFGYLATVVWPAAPRCLGMPPPGAAP
jgi:hypothetical protein